MRSFYSNFRTHLICLKRLVSFILFITLLVVLSQNASVSAQEEKIVTLFKDAIKTYETGEKEECLHQIKQLFQSYNIRNKTIVFHDRHYNLEAVGLNIIANICLDLGMVDEAEEALRRMVSDYSKTKILWPFFFEKEGNYYCKAGPLALEALYDLYSGKYGDGKKDLSLAQEIGHKLIKEFPGEKISYGDGFWEYIDHNITKKILSYTESVAPDSFFKAGEKILSESRNPFCRICVLDAFAIKAQKEDDYKKAIEIYNSIVEQFLDYFLEYNPFYKDYYRFVSPSYASLIALEEIGKIYLYRVKDKERASTIFTNAASLAEKLMSKKDHPIGRLHKQIKRYKLAAKGVFLPELPIVEGKHVVAHYNHIAWHPDSKKLAYIAYDDGIYEKNIEEQGDGDFITGPAKAVQYSSDGESLMYIWNGEIWFYSLQNTIKSKVTSKEKEGGIIEACLSPGDSLIAYRSSNKLYLLNLKTRKTESIGEDIFCPCWSPEGKTIIGIQIRDRQIVELDVTTGELKYYSLPDVGKSFPSFSPDGKYFVYNRIGGTDFAIVERDNGNVTELPLWYRFGGSLPKWSPDGRYIAYVGVRNKIFLATVLDGF